MGSMRNIIGAHASDSKQQILNVITKLPSIATTPYQGQHVSQQIKQ